MEQRASLLFQSWRNDWCKFIREVLGVNLDAEQEEIVRAVQHCKRVSVRSGTARGKDFVSACIAVSFMYLTPRWRRTDSGELELSENTKVALTAPTDRQVKNIMIPEISRLWNRAKRRGFTLPGRLNAYDIRTDNDEWFLTGFKADEHNHEAWSGFHAVNTMFIITEATGISDDTFAAIEGNLQGNSRILLVFNPNTTVGYAARSQKSDRWQRFSLNSLNAPNVKQRRQVIPGQVDYEWVLDKVRNWCQPITAEEARDSENDFAFEGQWYRPSDLFRKKVLGEFPKVSEDVLIPAKWIEIAQERWQQRAALSISQKEKQEAEAAILGVDVAGMGRDNSVYCRRRGALVEYIETHNSAGRADHMKVAGRVRVELTARGAVAASIDTIGEGAGVYARLLELSEMREHSALSPDSLISCKYSGAARTNGGTPLTDITGQYIFANMRAYLFWAVRDWLNPDNRTGAMLPPGGGLIEEASEIRWAFQSSGAIIIEPKEQIKERLGRSTDQFDALANTFHPDAIARAARQTNRPDEPTDEELEELLY